MNPYQVLWLRTGASMDEVKKAYRSLALKHHPDRGGDPAKMVEINEAYESLMKNKALIDAQLMPQPRRAQPARQGFTIIVGGYGWYGNWGATNNSTTGATFGF